LRSTHEELAKCKDQLDNAFQVVSPGFTTVRTHTRNALNKSCNIIGKKNNF
jgi:N-acyl-D-aspartate/D-glutamate deacylase